MYKLYTFILLIFSTTLMAQDINWSVTQAILEQKTQENPNDYYPIYILLEDQVNFQKLEIDFRAKNVSLEERVKVVLTELQTKATHSQKDLLLYLQQSDAILAESVHPYWVANVIFAQAKKEAIAKLSNDPSVAWIGYNGELATVETSYEGMSLEAVVEPDSIEPGLLAINAPAMWEMGYTGYGQVAFVNDTGVDPIHPAYQHKYRGYYSDLAQEGWFQFQSDNTRPFDCGDHGTHVLGTMMGLDLLTKDTVGVAFNAQWTGSPILCGIGTEDNVAAFQWSLDPDGNPNTIEDMPDVINNSWYDPDLQGGDCQSVYVEVLNALEAAGVAVVFSAGNAGPMDETITPPHNINTDIVNSFTVAALEVNPPYTAADFSSRGPSKCGGENSLLIKPEVAAPGVLVRSCGLNGTYNYKSGTSMASPHVCGAIMLLKEAFPYLTGRDFKLALYNTCTDLGEAGEDNTYGMGIINVLAAYEYLIAEGHTPVPPAGTANDIVLLEVKTRAIECGGLIDPIATIYNASTDTLYSLDFISTTDTGESMTYNWTGALSPDDSEVIVLPELNLPDGNYRLTVNTESPNGLVDERPMNNQYKSDIFVTASEPVTANLAYESVHDFCAGSKVLVQSDYDGVGTVQWYNAENNGDLLGEGNQLATTVDSSATLYADIVYREKVGMQNFDDGDHTSEDEIFRGLIFDANIPFVLKSVKVQLEQGGGREVALYFGSHQIAVKPALLIGTGEKKIDLNFSVPKATNLRLELSEGRPFVHSTSGFNYPYSIDDVVTITSAADSIGTRDDVYYYFYDWEIEYYDFCGRTPIEITTAPTDSTTVIPQATFEVSADVLLPGLGTAMDSIIVGQSIAFEDMSENVVEWLWDFGDGTTSTEQNPNHAFNIDGVHTISLSVISESGCADAFTTSVFGIFPVSNQDVSLLDHRVNVYPNPTNEQVNLAFNFAEQQTVDILIYDKIGRLIHQMPQQNIQNKDNIQLDLNPFPTGIYYIYIKTPTGQIVEKIVKM